LSPSPVVQVATPTSIVSASLATVIPTATVAITPVPVPTPIPTPEPIKIQFRDGAFNIPSSFEYFELKGFRVENVKELNASGGVSASVKWGDSNEWFGVPIDAETGEILAGHMYRSGGTFYADIKITSESGELFLHSFSIFVNGAVTVIQTPPTPIPTIGPSPTPTSTPIPGATATATPTPTSTPTVGPTPTPTVTPTSVPLADPVYDKIVFTAGSNEDGSGRTDIWMIDPDGSNKTNLTNTPDCVRERDAYISPSGRQIYLGGEWECYESGGPGVKDDAYRRGMRVMHPDGSNIVRLTDYGDEPGSLSPDGTKMVFRGARRAWSVEGQTGAWIMNADGSNQTRLVTWGPGDEQFCGQSPSEDSLSWSPDGTKLLFTASRLGCYGWSDAERIDRYGADSVPALPVDTGNHAEIYVMNADGSNVTRLTVTDQPSWSSKAAWSPDGNKITYASSQGSYPATSIWVMDADGSNPIDLNVSGSRPSWSPDGTKIVFDNNPNGIYVMNADGTNVVQLSSTGISPHWGPAAP
jgi:Tol biopolymer transport system component